MRTLAVAMLLAIAGAGTAHADDDAPPPEINPPGDDGELDASTGYIGGPTLTPEVDDCESPTDLTEDQARQRASEHYQRGNTLYVQGDYEGAIEEFVAAYCDAPHYEMLRNIAQSFERMLAYEKAVAYLSRFILELPRDDPSLQPLVEQISFRVQVLSNLEARIRVATVPPGARVTLNGETGINAHGFADAVEPIKARKGSYAMRVELDGYEPIDKTIEVEIGQPYSYYFQLEPKKGTVRVVTDPSNARIFVDQRLVGLGSYAERLPVGEHVVTVEADGREPTTRTLEVTDGRTSSVTITLQKPPKSGRRQLIIGSSVGGLLFGSGTFATVFEEGPLVSLGGVLGLGLGFAGGYFGVPHRISVGRSSYIIGTTFIAAAEGALIAHWGACDTDVDLTADANCGEVVGGATVAAGVGGLLVGAITADDFDFDAGQAALINSGAQWGTVGGLLFVAAFENDRALLSPLGLAGLNLGLVAGTLVSKRMDASRGRVALIDLSGLAGMIAGVAMVDVVEPGGRSERLPHFALLGMTAGLITGAYLTRNMDEPKAAPLRSLQPVVGSARGANGATPTFGLAGHF